MASDARIPTLLARVYQACHFCCKPSAPEVTLRRCSRCRRVCYDTVECQKADWREHKAFCTAYTDLDRNTVDLLGIPPSYLTTDVGDLKARAMLRVQKKARVLEASLGGRDLAVWERNLLGWEPRCLGCARTEGDVRACGGPNAPLAPCADCQLTFFCSDEHRSATLHMHTHTPDPDSAAGLSQCAMNQTIRQDALILGAMDEPVRWAPERQKAQWERLEGRTWEGEYSEGLRRMGLPPPAVGTFLRAATHGLTFPMTILWGLEQLHGADEAWTQKDTLTIHIIGATQEELLCAMQFEEILHRLPKVKMLHLVLIGPGISQIHDDGTPIPMDVCPGCAARGRRRMHFHHSSLYHDFAAGQGASWSAPDLAVAFNSGCASDETESWLPTLCLLAEKGVPSVFTAFNRGESERDSALLRASGANLAPELTGPNPWASLDLQLEPNRVRGYYSYNGFIAGVFK